MSWVLDLGGHLGHWAPIVTILGLLSALRIVLGLVENLHDLVKAFVLPRIFPVDLGKTFGRWAIAHCCTIFLNIREIIWLGNQLGGR